MLPKHLLLICISFICVSQPSQAQLLKKIKDKVNKTITGDNTNTESKETREEDKPSASASSGNSSSGAVAGEDAKGPSWCDGLDASGGGAASGGTASKDGVDYRKAFSNNNNFSILYDESSLALRGDPGNYRLVVSERVNNKTQFKLIENGEVTDSGPGVKPDWLSRGTGRTVKNEDDRQAAMAKYIVGDTIKQNIPKTDANKVTVQKTSDEQLEMTLSLARQTDEYKNMSDAEKKEFEQTLREGIAKNNSMAGTTFDVPAQQGGTVAIVNGYFVIVKGKKYGKFMMPPAVDVSRDETKVFAVGLSDQNKPTVIANGKTTTLDPNKYLAISGQIIRSADEKKAVYIEPRKMSEKELEEFTSNQNQRKPTEYNVIRSDGSELTVTDYTYSSKFKLTNTGKVIYVNEETGEVFADNKLVGKFPLKNGDQINLDAVMIGNDVSSIAHYNGSDGSLTYLDGNVRKLGIISPRVVAGGGKSQLTWFRKCGNDIYIASFAY